MAVQGDAVEVVRARAYRVFLHRGKDMDRHL